MLSFCRVGNSYPVSQLTPIQLQLMMEFSHLGIIYRASPQSPRFYPTQIAVNIIIGSGTATHKLKSLNSLTPEYSEDTPTPPLTSSSSLLPTNQSAPSATSAAAAATTSTVPSANLSGLELIVETNFQVVAYFTSDLHLAMLSLFVDNRGLVRLPNMALGQITRDSIKSALKMGIKASQIINFMKIHTHSNLSHRQPLIPENVTDQIKLWESERYRLKLQPSMLLNLTEITSGKHLEELYQSLKRYSQEINVLLWFDDQKKCLVVTSEGYYQLDAYSRTLE
jgi:transcription initiation factor TFIIH subunit 4